MNIKDYESCKYYCRECGETTFTVVHKEERADKYINCPECHEEVIIYECDPLEEVINDCHLIEQSWIDYQEMNKF